MANPPDNDQNNNPSGKTPERNLAAPATTRPTDSLKDKAANVAASTTENASQKLDELTNKTNTDSPRTLSPHNLADKTTAASNATTDTMKAGVSRATSAGSSAISGATATGAAAIGGAAASISTAAAGVKSTVTDTAHKLGDSPTPARPSANPPERTAPAAGTMTRPPGLGQASASTRPPAVTQQQRPPLATTGQPAASQTPLPSQRPTESAQGTSATPPRISHPSNPAQRRPEASRRDAPATSVASSQRPQPSRTERPPGLTRPSLERPNPTDRPTTEGRPAKPASRPLTRPTAASERSPSATDQARPAIRAEQNRPLEKDPRPAAPRNPKGEATRSQRQDRPHDDRPRRPGPPPRRPEMRPRNDRPPAHFRDDPRPRRRMAPPPGASKNGHFLGRPTRRGPAPINPATTPEGGAWGPLLFGLLLLGGVAWYAIKHYTPQIQEDLLRRSNASLDEAGLGNQTDVAISGRNIILSGSVATQADSDTAEQAVAETFGVRDVENNLSIGEPAVTEVADVELQQPSLSLTRQGDGVTLAGTVSDEKFATAITSAAGTQYGEANVSSSITVDENVTNPGWLSAVTQLMPEMDGVEGSGLNIENGTLTLTGTTSDANTKESVGAKANELLKGHLTVDNQIVAPEPVAEPEAAVEPAAEPEAAVEPAAEPEAAVEPVAEPEAAVEPVAEPEPVVEPTPAPRELPSFASVSETDDQITLTGFMTQDSANQITSVYESSSKEVVNNISINELADTPNWIDDFSQSMASMENVQNGKITMARSGNVTLQGTVDNEALKQSTADDLSSLFGDEYKIINNIAVELPPVVPTMQPFASIIDNEEQISISGLLPKESARELLRTYRRGDKYVADNIAIDERVIAPAWTDQLGQSLASVDNIENPKINITSSGDLIVGGHAQTEDARTAAADQLSTLFGNSVSLRNDITVETPKIQEAPKPDFRDLLAQIDIAGIRFGTNSAELNSDSIVILEQVTELLNQYQNVNVEIAGHTDSLGSQQYNLALSADRATTVMQFLDSKGISPNRMTAKGYGPARPVASNDTAAERAQNRRIEFTLTGE